MQKNEVLTATVDSLGYNGEGILHVDGTTVFVPFSLPCEKIEFKVLKVKGNVAFGKLQGVIEPSKDRVEPKCPYFYKCGGCQLQHLEYNEQIKLKEEIVKGCFQKIAGIKVNVDKAFKSPKEYEYRNKLQLPIRDENGQKKLGFFRENSHDVIDVNSCAIQPKWVDKIIEIFRNYIKYNGISCYSEKTKKGKLKHLVVREINGELIVVVVANARKIFGVNGLIARLIAEFKNVSLYLNVNEEDNNVVLGKEFILLYGKEKISIEEFEIKYEIGPNSFFQVNTLVKREIYSDLIEKTKVDKSTTVIDAYSGAGVLTAMLAKKAKTAVGIEIIEEAVDSAKNLAINNELDNVEFICSPCETALPKLLEEVENFNENSLLVFDPPRKGVDYKILEKTLEVMPKQIAYISCSPQTLARDIGVLIGSLKYENGQLINLSADFLPNYEIKFVGIYDMFCQTKHVESLVCLERKTN